MQIKCLPLRAQILTAIYRFKKKTHIIYLGLKNRKTMGKNVFISSNTPYLKIYLVWY